MTSRVLNTRVDGHPDSALAGRPVVHSVWDARRLWRYSTSRVEKEDIEINFRTEYGGGLPALPADAASGTYGAYLAVMPGSVLARIYDTWTTRLLEQNVRVFLQTRTGVNKGIRRTIEDCPDMFFAYNNGITATAEAVAFDDDAREIITINNLQIVNGGQTTASIHAAFRAKKDLARVSVQMKLSIVPNAESSKVVPLISRYANSQNKISDADFFSNHPFHIRIEEFSRRVLAPIGSGSKETKWFYERARGQYVDARTRLDGKKLRLFEQEFPKTQLFTKTDLAKFETVWDSAPHVVSKGAQKCFAEFARRVSERWATDETDFNESKYREYIAKAIIFRATEQNVEKAPWYADRKGYRANIVAYAIAKVSNDLKKLDRTIDFEAVWRAQQVPQALVAAIDAAAQASLDVLEAPEGTIRNVTEWAKKDACWRRFRDVRVQYPGELSTLLLGKADLSEARRDARKDQVVLNGIAAQTALVKTPPAYWIKLLDWGRKHRLLTENDALFLDILTVPHRGKPLSEAQAQKALRIADRLIANGYAERYPR
jgi:hypothetical protein